MSNKLPLAKRAQILSTLVEGASMGSVSPVANVSINTVAKLLAEAGEACAAHHDEAVVGVKVKRVQCNEIWSFYANKWNAADTSQTLWSIEDVVALIDARAETPKARGAYKPRAPKISH